MVRPDQDGFQRVVGIKQVMRALKSGAVQKVFVAEDADRVKLRGLLDLSKEKSATVLFVKTMRELGQDFGIDVKAAAAALLKQV